ncbi:MAG: cytidine/deoxycytidylate deaminase family protein [Lacunisphaera sp.]|nr:cytidine/deoxycytidylate deaminase family protein [Lacunisphaera sp.]
MTLAKQSALPAIADQVEIFGARETINKIRGTHSKELVIGLCGPIGTPIRGVAVMLESLLRDTYHYDPVTIKLSSFIEEHTSEAPKGGDQYKRYKHLIDEGNALRSRYGNAILAELAVKDILIKRSELIQKSGSAEPQPERFCHIVDSIKNHEELELLQLVYGELFVMIGVYSSPEERERNLLLQRGVHETSLSGLIARDSGEDVNYGQEVRKTFPLSDFFINTGNGNDAEIRDKLGRILEIVTRTKIVTPTKAETAMYAAYAASLNSGCLSRQVGAVVTDADLDVLGVGWNDVPKFGGSLYTADSNPDNRCMHRRGGICSNDLEKDIIATEIAEAVVGIFESSGIQDLAKIKASDIKTKIKKSRINDLIEFSRAVHAEMMAIINAGTSGNGQRMRNGKVFVTTYPCHSCARHIVAAGITEVFFIEPYRKSLAKKLHDDTITESHTTMTHVRVLPYEGVGPSKYVKLFRMTPTGRKDGSGKMQVPKSEVATITSETSLKSYPSLEQLILEQLRERGLVERPTAPLGTSA